MGVDDGVRRLPSSGSAELRVGGEAPLGARVPRERLDDPLSPVPAQSLAEFRVGEDLGEPRAQLSDVSRLDQEARHTVLHDLGQPADPARDHGRAARHRLDRRKAQELGNRDVSPVARPVYRRQRDGARLAVERGKVRVGDGAEELDAALGSEPPKQRRVVAFRRVRVVPGRADDPQLGVLRERLDQAVDALVRGQPSDEDDAAATVVTVGVEAIRVGAAVDDAGLPCRRAEVARRIGRYREKAVEEPREQPSPVSSAEPVVGDGRRESADARVHGRDSARRASEVVGVDDIGAGQRVTEPERQRVCRVPAEGRNRPEDADAQPAGIAPRLRSRPEADELAIDVARERATELERVALAAPEEPRRAEERRSDVDDPHLVLPLVTLGDPRRLSGGYLYHLRMADAAAAHGARIAFVSFPERTFPLGALRGLAVLQQVKEHGGHAVLLDSIAAALAAPALATGRFDVPVVGVLHQPPGGIDHGPVRARVQALLDRLAWRRADLLIAASDHLAEQLVAAGFAQSRVRVVPPGRDVAPAPRGPAPDLRDGRRAAFLTVANWFPRKGILELLEALAQLPVDAATLHLAGDESGDPRYAARVRSRLAEQDLRGRVVVHGRLARERVDALYRAADVFVLPAYREPYGTVWGEAMALGLPVVGWRAGNLPYLADDGREAILVQPGDVEALARALLRLALDEETRIALGAAAERRALRRPTWDESAALFFAAIREVLR